MAVLNITPPNPALGSKHPEAGAAVLGTLASLLHPYIEQNLVNSQAQRESSELEKALNVNTPQTITTTTPSQNVPTPDISNNLLQPPDDSSGDQNAPAGSTPSAQSVAPDTTSTSDTELQSTLQQPQQSNVASGAQNLSDLMYGSVQGTTTTSANPAYRSVPPIPGYARAMSGQEGLEKLMGIQGAEENQNLAGLAAARRKANNIQWRPVEDEGGNTNWEGINPLTGDKSTLGKVGAKPVTPGSQTILQQSNLAADKLGLTGEDKIRYVSDLVNSNKQQTPNSLMLAALGPNATTAEVELNQKVQKQQEALAGARGAAFAGARPIPTLDIDPSSPTYNKPIYRRVSDIPQVGSNQPQLPVAGLTPSVVEANAQARQRGSNQTANVNVANDLFQKNLPDIIQMRNDIQSKLALLPDIPESTDLNGVKQWALQHSSDPTYAVFSGKLIMMADMLQRTLGGTQGGQWQYDVANTLLDKKLSPAAFAARMYGHADDLAEIAAGRRNFGLRAPTPSANPNNPNNLRNPNYQQSAAAERAPAAQGGFKPLF